MLVIFLCFVALVEGYSLSRTTVPTPPGSTSCISGQCTAQDFSSSVFTQTGGDVFCVLGQTATVDFTLAFTIDKKALRNDIVFTFGNGACTVRTLSKDAPPGGGSQCAGNKCDFNNCGDWDYNTNEVVTIQYTQIKIPCLGSGGRVALQYCVGWDTDETACTVNTPSTTNFGPKCSCGTVLTNLTVCTDCTSQPVGSPTPTNQQISCEESIPAVPTVTWTDADSCNPYINTTYASVTTQGNCDNRYVIDRTWTGTDSCPTTVVVTQKITVTDNKNPVIDSPPGPVEVKCGANVPTAADLGCTDNCGTCSATSSDQTTAGSCANKYTVTRTWNANDACNNAAAPQVQTITVNDDVKPTLSNPSPSSVNVQCAGDVPNAPTVTCSDNCAQTCSPTFSALTTPGSCSNKYVLTRTWTANDICGNAADPKQQIVTVNDDTAPVLEVEPNDASYSCNSQVPSAPSLSYTDNCGGSGSVSPVTTVVGGEVCINKKTITNTWTANDGCGNTATREQTITVNDASAPTFASPPGDVTVQCGIDVPSPVNLAWTDNCDGSGTDAPSDSSTTPTCPDKYVITRTWEQTDICGNTRSVSQKITVNDNVPPTITCPANVQDCNFGFGVPSTSDSCGSVASLTSSTSSGTCSRTRTWTATDECGNSASCSQVITCPCPCCTLTQGYWKTHSGNFTPRADPTWALCGCRDSTFYQCGISWLSLFTTPPKNSDNKWVLIAGRQWAAAYLNLLKCGQVATPEAVMNPEELSCFINLRDNYFNANSCIIAPENVAYVVGCGQILDWFNNGLGSAPHCGDNDGEDPDPCPESLLN